MAAENLKPLGWNQGTGHIVQTPNNVRSDATSTVIATHGGSVHCDILWQEGPMGDVPNGVTPQDIVRVLIERLEMLNKEVPCRENSIVLTKLEECQMWLALRVARRQREGTVGSKNV